MGTPDGSRHLLSSDSLWLSSTQCSHCHVSVGMLVWQRKRTWEWQGDAGTCRHTYTHTGHVHVRTHRHTGSMDCGSSTLPERSPKYDSFHLLLPVSCYWFNKPLFLNNLIWPLSLSAPWPPGGVLGDCCCTYVTLQVASPPLPRLGSQSRFCAIPGQLGTWCTRRKLLGSGREIRSWILGSWYQVCLWDSWVMAANVPLWDLCLDFSLFSPSTAGPVLRISGFSHSAEFSALNLTSLLLSPFGVPWAGVWGLGEMVRMHYAGMLLQGEAVWGCPVLGIWRPFVSCTGKGVGCNQTFVRQVGYLWEGNPASKLLKLEWGAEVERFVKGLEKVVGALWRDWQAPSAGSECVCPGDPDDPTCHQISLYSSSNIPFTVTFYCLEYWSHIQWPCSTLNGLSADSFVFSMYTITSPANNGCFILIFITMAWTSNTVLDRIVLVDKLVLFLISGGAPSVYYH